MKKYRPNWQRILILALALNAGAAFAVAGNFSSEPPKVEADDLQEIEWYEEPGEVADVMEDFSQPVQTFPDIVFPPIEIPAVPEIVIEQPIVEEKPAAVQPVEKPTEKPAEMTADGKLKVLSKVLPRDVVAMLISSGVIQEGRAPRAGKIVVAVTVGADGKAKNAEIRRGGGNDENGAIINILAEAAATAWIFEPFKDADGQTKEIKTQIEFKPEDF